MHGEQGGMEKRKMRSKAQLSMEIDIIVKDQKRYTLLIQKSSQSNVYRWYETDVILFYYCHVYLSLVHRIHSIATQTK